MSIGSSSTIKECLKDKLPSLFSFKICISAAAETVLLPLEHSSTNGAGYIYVQFLVASKTSSESGGSTTTQKFERSLFYFVCSLQIYKHHTYIKFHMIFIEPYFGWAYLV